MAKQLPSDFNMLFGEYHGKVNPNLMAYRLEQTNLVHWNISFAGSCMISLPALTKDQAFSLAQGLITLANSIEESDGD